MRSYRWEKVNLQKESSCNKCSESITAEESVWERTGVLSFVGFEPGKDELPPVHFHVFHYLPPQNSEFRLISKK